MKEQKVLSALQYLLDEGFIVPGFRDGEPTLFLTTELSEAHKAISKKTEKHNEDWWANEQEKE